MYGIPYKKLRLNCESNKFQFLKLVVEFGINEKDIQELKLSILGIKDKVKIAQYALL